MEVFKDYAYYYNAFYHDKDYAVYRQNRQFSDRKYRSAGSPAYPYRYS